jgi:deoxycytidylate deaminase
MPLTRLDLHFLQLATAEAQKDGASNVNSGLKRKTRGCVIASGNQIISTGSSTHLGGQQYKPQTDERYVATINAENVAIGKAVQKGTAKFDSATIYITDCPNWYTFKLLVTVGLKRIVHYGPITNPRIVHYSKDLNIDIISVG